MWFVDVSRGEKICKKDAGLVALSHPFSSVLTEVQRASRKAGIVLFSAGSCYIRPVRFGWFPFTVSGSGACTHFPTERQCDPEHGLLGTLHQD